MNITDLIEAAAQQGKNKLNNSRGIFEWKIQSLRECPLPGDLAMCDEPGKAAAYWRAHVATSDGFNPEVECLVVLLLNSRRRVKGHVLISTGTMDQILCHAREVFRAAVIGSAHSLLLMHNHPSGDCQPSDSDIRMTRDLRRAGEILKIELVDHVIIGAVDHCSLKQLGLI